MRSHFYCTTFAAFCTLLLFPFELATPAAAQNLPQVKTVFVIGMENHNFTQPTPTSSPQQILNNTAAPYINSLITPGNSNAAQVSYCTHHYNAGVGVHPSEPNYIWAEAGTDFGDHVDTDPSSGAGNIFTAPHLTGQLNTAGIAWKNYQEDVQLSSGPAHSVSGTSTTVINPYYSNGQYSYGAKHNPMVFFSDTQTQNVYPLTQFATDLTNHALGRYNWITPNLYNDQHTGLTGGFTYHGVAYTGDQAAVAQGDNFLSILIPRIMATTEYQDHGIIIIRWDETEGGDTTGYTIPEILISPLAKGNAYASSVEMSHSSDLKTMEEIFGLNYLNNAIPASETKVTGSGYNNVATVNDMSDLFQPVPGIIVQQPAGASLTNGLSTVSFGTVNPGSSVTNIFMVTNSGNAALNLTNVVVTGANAADFAVNAISLPSTLAVAGTTTFKVVFSPAACGARSATLQITNNDSNHDPFTISFAGTGNPAPVITSQPGNETNNVGTSATFSVTSTACTTLSYQWYFGTNSLPGQTNSDLNLPSVAWTNAGNYHVVVTCSGGSTTSAIASLQIIIQAPTLAGGQIPDSGAFQLMFAGPPGQTYQVLATDDLKILLANWTVTGIGTFAGTNASFTDSDSTNHPNRFYTIKSP